MPEVAFGPFSEGLNSSLSKVAKPQQALEDAVNVVLSPVGDISSAYESTEFIQFNGPGYDIIRRAIEWEAQDVFVRLDGKTRTGDNEIRFSAKVGFTKDALGTNEATAIEYEGFLVIAEETDDGYPFRVYGDKGAEGLFIPIGSEFEETGAITAVSGTSITGSGTFFTNASTGDRFYFVQSVGQNGQMVISYEIQQINSDTEIIVDRNVEQDLINAGISTAPPPARFRIVTDRLRGYSPAVYRNRIFFFDKDRRNVFFTGFPGSEAGSNDIFDWSYVDPLTIIQLGDTFGEGKRLAVAGSALYAVHNRGAFAITGEPPIDAALGNPLRITPLTQSIGANTYDSVTITRDGQGLLIASPTGLWQLYGNRSTRVDDPIQENDFYDPEKITHVAADQRFVYFSDPEHDWKRVLEGRSRVSSQEPYSFVLDQRTGAYGFVQRLTVDNKQICPIAQGGYGMPVIQTNVNKPIDVFVGYDRRINRLNKENEGKKREYGLSAITAHLDLGRGSLKLIHSTHVHCEEPGSEDLALTAPAEGIGGKAPIYTKTIGRTSFDPELSRYTVFNGQGGKGTSHISAGIGHFADILYGGTSSDNIQQEMDQVQVTNANRWIISKFLFNCDKFRQPTTINRIDILVKVKNVNQAVDSMELAVIGETGGDFEVIESAAAKFPFSDTQFFADEYVWVSAYIDPVEFDSGIDNYYVGFKHSGQQVTLPLETAPGETVDQIRVDTDAIEATLSDPNRRLKVRLVNQLGAPFVGSKIGLINLMVEERAGGGML